jgi:hypothetical protein
LLIFALFAPVDALGKGGTNMHEMASSSHAAVASYQPTLPSSGFAGCGRYHEPSTHKCRGPVDFGKSTVVDSLEKIGVLTRPNFFNAMNTAS